MPQKAATGVWTIVEHHTILMVAIFKYLNIWKYFIFNAKHNSVFPSIFWIFLCKRFFFENLITHICFQGNELFLYYCV